MKFYNLILPLFLFLALALCIAFSSDDTETDTVDSSDIESNELSTRGLATVVQSKAYHFKNMAVFENGVSVMTLNDLANMQGKKLNFVLLYDPSTPWASVFSSGNYATTGNDAFNSLMDAYHLEIIEQFEIDDENEGIVLDPFEAVENPIDAAKSLSLIDGVLMVQIKEVPSDKEPSTTADNQ